MTCLSMYPWTEEGESQRPSCMSRVVSAASCQWRSQVAEMRMRDTSWIRGNVLCELWALQLCCTVL